MAAKPTAPLSQADLAQFITQEANFAFEMKALASIRDAGFQAEHAATYKDPVSGKLRAFDIRARFSGDVRSLRFAVECKNLRSHSPLVVHATRRTQQESTHDVVARYRLGHQAYQDTMPRDGIYPKGEAVGRQTDQPLKDVNGDFKSNDSDTYDKWSQAVSGCQDLVHEMVNAHLGEPEVCAIVPMLVVPDDVLWEVQYDERGNVITPVRRVDRSTLILRQHWSTPTYFGPLHYGMSHIEVVTLSALAPRMAALSGPAGLCAGAIELLAMKMQN